MPRPLGADVLHRFLDLVVGQLRDTVGVDATLSMLASAGDAGDTIAVTIDFAGDVRGPITWVFPRPIALELVRRMLHDPAPRAEIAPDGATELANILTGRAALALEDYGFRCGFGVPRLHHGALPGGLIVRMQTAAGPIDLVLSMGSATTRLRTIPAPP
ncbi:MAG: chemotaxis protein CheX [Myxococcales bacterium]|nr:chemotaxis protein CheX [Myxococcales bacterium]MBP6849002.1 chemotaxis protein CheX [Kofleriaceae bacterium]